MKSHLLILALALTLSLAERVTYNNYKLYKIIPKDKEALHVLKNLEKGSTDFSPYDFWSEPAHVNQPVSLMVSPDFQHTVEDMLKPLNVTKDVVIQDVQKVFDAEKRSLGNEPNQVNWTLYNTLDEINNWLEDLAVEFSDYITILKPGKSHEGRDIVGVKLDLTPETADKEVVFMEANIHAREWITSATTTYILNEFLRSTDENVLAVARRYVWYFFPVMNPDGFEYSHTTNRLWRKTRTRYNIFCWGADPNRNWDSMWMVTGASQNPCSDLYAGPVAFSEPSVRVMKDFIETIADNMVAYLDFHSFSQMLLLPYGHTTEHLDNYQEMREIGEYALGRLTSLYDTVYTIGNVPEILYEVSGSSMDWVKANFHTPIVYCWELRDLGSYGFVLPAEQIIPTSIETLESVIAIFEAYVDRSLLDNNN